MSRHIVGFLKKCGLWNMEADRPQGIVWLYFSDLLVLVPYERQEEYPACCYNLYHRHLGKKERNLIINILSRTMTRLSNYIEKALVYLPKT